MTPFAKHLPGIFLIAAACGSLIALRPASAGMLGPYLDSPSVTLQVASVGLWTAGATYLNIYLTWGTEPFARRLLWSALIVAGTSAASYFSLAPKRDHFQTEIFNYVPFSCVAFQVPFWIPRILSGRRIVRGNQTAEVDRWSLRDCAVGTILLAAALATIRPVIQNNLATLLPPVLCFSVAMPLLLLPPAYYTLRTDSMQLAIIGFLLNTAALGIFLVAIALSRLMPWHALRELILILLTTFLGGCGALWCLRGEGYRLLSGRETSFQYEYPPKE